jgi:hypothetical protein
MPSCVAQIQEIGGNIERVAGTDVRDKVMAGSESITASAKSPAMALWLQGAMARLDLATDEGTRQEIMLACGRTCAHMNDGLITRAKKRRRRFETEEEFLSAEQLHPPVGTRLRQDGSTLFQFYTPHSYTRPMRCYCGLLRGLPADQTVSLTYCYCSRGFVETYWQEVLGRPVAVDLVGSCISGAEECTFVIHL